ncbi:MAG: penicillin-binding protein [Lachnospiraceae bacterium]|nr:penicillin-binding protein [Lachnospiraceae bacterium]
MENQLRGKNQGNEPGENMENKVQNVDNSAVIKRRVFLGIKIFAVFCLLVVLIGGIVVYAKYGTIIMDCYSEASKIAADSKPDDFRKTGGAKYFDASGNEIKALSRANSDTYLTCDEIPQLVKETFIVSEDKDFYNHKGISYKGNVRAVIAIIKDNGKLSQGGSTITQQLTRNIYLTFEKSIERKLKEMFISLKLEEAYSKDQILEYYINNIYFRNNHYGIESAAQGYFGKSISECTLAQQVFLCAIPNRPAYYDPYTNFDHTIKRKDRLLKQLHDDGKISDDMYTTACNEEIVVGRFSKTKENIPQPLKSYIEECAVRALMAASGFEFQYGFTKAQEDEFEEYKNERDEIFKDWANTMQKNEYYVYTSIDFDAQNALQEAVNNVLNDANTDLNDEGIYEFQGSAVCIDNDTGKVVAMVNGRTQADKENYGERAYNNYRQPGSSIKPILVYGPAYDMRDGNGNAVYTLDSTMVDEKIDSKWAPKNASGTYLNREVTFKEALARSLNTIPWLLFRDMKEANGGKLNYCFDYLKKMNFNKITMDDADGLSAAIGGTKYGTNTLEMAAAYATIENEGEYRQPSCVIRITNKDGETVTEDRQGVREVYDINTTKQLIESMQAVLYADYGSATKVPVNGQDCAGKTGTTDGYKDGWMCGFTKYYTTAVWCGNDHNTTADSNTGATFAGKIWHDYMTVIHEGLARKEFDTTVVGLNTGKHEEEQVDDSSDGGGFWDWNIITDWINTKTKEPEPTPEPEPEPIKTKKPRENDNNNDNDDYNDVEETESPEDNYDDNQEPDVHPEEPSDNNDDNNNNDNWNNDNGNNNNWNNNGDW